MDLRQLELFVAVAEDGHFTRAAERIGVAQPAVSQQIGRLERELDARLFVRDRRGVRLTAAGEALLPRARATLAAAAGARSAVAAVRGVIEGRLAIGSIPEVREARLPRLLGEFRRAHPGVDLTLVEGSTDALGEALLAGGLDVAVLGTGPRQRPAAGLESILVHREPSLVAVPPGHPLAAHRSVTLATLRDEPFVSLATGTGLRTMLDVACRAAGFTPRVVAQSTEPRLVVELVAEGLGVAIVPESALRATPNLPRLRLAQPTLERRAWLAWRGADPSPAARAFVELARRELESGANA